MVAMTSRGRSRGGIRIVKMALATALYYSGLLHVLWLMKLRGKAIVLMYHRVLTPAERDASFSHRAIIVDRERFEHQVWFLKRRARIISLEEFTRRLTAGVGFESASCLITFDDGWADNYTNALPVLQAHGVPAAVFLVTGCVGTDRKFWRERLGSLLFDAHRSGARFGEGTAPAALLREIAAYDEDSARTAIRAWVDAWKERPRDLVETLLEEVEARVPRECRRSGAVDALLSWGQVEEMLRHGIEAGSHGVSHRILTGLGDDELAREIDDSRETLRSATGAPPLAFSYPNGDFDERAKRLVGEAYPVSFSTVPGLVAPHEDRRAVRRVNIHDGACRSLPLFVARVLGIL